MKVHEFKYTHNKYRIGVNLNFVDCSKFDLTGHVFNLQSATNHNFSF